MTPAAVAEAVRSELPVLSKGELDVAEVLGALQHSSLQATALVTDLSVIDLSVIDLSVRNSSSSRANSTRSRCWERCSTRPCRQTDRTNIEERNK